MISEETTPDLEKSMGYHGYTPAICLEKVFPLLGISECLPCRKCKENNIMNMSQYPTTQTHLRGWWYITSHHESSMTPVKWKKYDFEQMTFASQLVQHFQTNP